MSLPTFNRGDGIFESAAPDTWADIHKDPDHHENLIFFLSVLQHFQVDLLPITWQPALDGLGQGASATVEQSLISAQLSFAFKRTSRNATYKVLVSEIAILSHPSIREHPNMNRIQGICWEIGKPETGTRAKVWPVLVYAKAPFGDLNQFLKSNAGRKLGIDARLRICKDVARAVETLHSCNIVHGDLKPENILIFEGTGFQEVVAKVSDFGYSGIWVSADGAIRLPETKPWSAPEYHSRAFKLRDAKKLDIYTYGLVCLWILLQCSEFDGIQRQLATRLCIQGLKWNIPVLEKFKRDGSLAALINETFESDDLENSIAMSRFHAILVKSLSYNAGDRIDSMLSILTILNGASLGSRTDVASHELNLHLPLHAQLDITDSFLLTQLASSEIEVRLYLTDQMHAVLEKKENLCQDCLESAAFQSAIQYSLGFGVPLNKDQAQQLLSLSHHDQEDLQHEILNIKSAASPNHSFRPGPFEDLIEQGFVGTSVTNPELRCSYGAETKSFLDQRWRQEIYDVGNSLGQLHDVSRILKTEFSKILHQDGFYEEASQSRYDLLKSTVELYGEDHPDTLALMNGTALALVEAGRLSEATDLSQRALPLFCNVYGEDHLRTVRAKEDLAFCLSKQGRHDRAQELSQQYLHTLEKLMGETHPTTCIALHNHVFFLHENGSLDDAEKLSRLAVARCRGSYGEQDQWTVRAKSGLSHVLTTSCDHVHDQSKVRNMLAEAERLRDEALDYFKVTRGSSHPETLTAIAELAAVYMSQQRAKKAMMTVEKALEMAPQRLAVDMSVIGLLEMHSQALAAQGLFEASLEVEDEVYEKMKIVRGESHPDTIVVMENLAHSCRELNDLERSEELTKDVLQQKLDRHGNEHQETNKTRSILADLYERQSRWPDAEQEYRIVLHSRQKTLKPLHPFVTFSKVRVANLLQRRGEWDEALSLNQQVLEARQETKPPNHQTIFDTLNNVAAILSSQNRLADAETVYVDILARSRQYLDPAHPQTLQAVQNLTAFYTEQKRWPKAQRCLEEEVKLRREYTYRGRDDEGDLLLALGNLAITCGYRKDWAVAVELLREVCEGKRRTVREGHGDLVQAETLLKRAEAELLHSRKG